MFSFKSWSLPSLQLLKVVQTAKNAVPFRLEPNFVKSACRIVGLSDALNCKDLSRIPRLCETASIAQVESRPFTSASNEEEERDRMEYDVVVVGAGPAGLACAIRLKQKNENLSVCVVEKGAEVGSHIVSGNVFDPRALTELFPEWKTMGTPISTEVSSDEFYIFTDTSKLLIPSLFLPKELKNHGNYVISLGALCKWMSSEAVSLGIEIYPGFSAKKLLIDEETNTVRGIQIADVGISKKGQKKLSYQPGMQLYGKQTIIAEGCHGSLAEEAIERFSLRSMPLLKSITAAARSLSVQRCCPQQYGLGLKEIWEVLPEKCFPGRVAHAVGWPLGLKNYGGTFMYHAEPNLVYVGMVVGLDYKNPYLSPYEEFQRFKHHPFIRKVLEGGRCVSYGARCLNEGGLQALPKLTFGGGMIIGCSAGYLNVPKIKGTHTAMKSGILAADTIADKLSTSGTPGHEFFEYNNVVKKSWIWDELYKVRNAKPSFKTGGLIGGLAYSGISLHLFRGREPWTFTWSKEDHESTEPAILHSDIQYSKRVEGLSFNLLDNLAKSGTYHEHDQIAHLQVKENLADIPVDMSYNHMAGLESRFCPAGVYEYVSEESSAVLDSRGPSSGIRLQINAQNCLHCKTCAIKSPKKFIRWTVPEGGGGPAYENM